jgi:hypothetical protein
MEDVIKIGNKDVRVSNNVSWALEYRDQFGKDVVQDHVPMIAALTEAVAPLVVSSDGSGKITVAEMLEAVQGNTIDILVPLMQADLMTTIINVTWAMAKAADEDIDPPKIWAKQFDEFPLDEVVPKIYKLMTKGLISSKNFKRLESLIATFKTIQPSTSIQSSSQESSED